VPADWLAPGQRQVNPPATCTHRRPYARRSRPGGFVFGPEAESFAAIVGRNPFISKALQPASGLSVWLCSVFSHLARGAEPGSKMMVRNTPMLLPAGAPHGDGVARMRMRKSAIPCHNTTGEQTERSAIGCRPGGRKPAGWYSRATNDDAEQTGIRKQTGHCIQRLTPQRRDNRHRPRKSRCGRCPGSARDTPIRRGYCDWSWTWRYTTVPHVGRP
jgi:hypothetical protein